MKCIPSCGYSEKPDNLKRLTRHLEDCLSTGACSRLPKDPFVIWKDGEFTVATKKTKKDRVFDVVLVKKEALELKPTQIKTPSEYRKKPEITQGTIEETVRTKKPVKKLKAKLPDELQADPQEPIE